MRFFSGVSTSGIKQGYSKDTARMRRRKIYETVSGKYSVVLGDVGAAIVPNLMRDGQLSEHFPYALQETKIWRGRLAKAPISSSGSTSTGGPGSMDFCPPIPALQVAQSRSLGPHPRSLCRCLGLRRHSYFVSAKTYDLKTKRRTIRRTSR